MARTGPDEILDEWGEDGRDAARESLWIDFGFLLAYGTFLTLALAWARDTIARRDFPRLSRAGPVAVWLGGRRRGLRRGRELDSAG